MEKQELMKLSQDNRYQDLCNELLNTITDQELIDDINQADEQSND